MKASLDPSQLYGYIKSLFDSGKFDRLIGERFFQGTVTSITGTSYPYKVSLQRSGDTASDQNTYLVLNPSYVPAVGDVVECVYRDLNVAHVLGPVGVYGHYAALASSNISGINAGISGTPTISGTDMRGSISFTTTGAAPAAGADLFTLTFNKQFEAVPIVLLTNQGGQAVSLPWDVYSPLKTGWHLSNGLALANATPYVVYYGITP